MIEETYNIGKVLMGRGAVDPVEIFMDTAKLKKTKKVLCIIMRIEGVYVEYNGVDIEDYDPQKAKRYLYRGGPPNGTDITPSSLIQKSSDHEKSISKAINRIIRWFENNKEQGVLIDRSYSEISTKREEIINDLLDIYGGIDGKSQVNVLLTVKFRDKSSEKYLGDMVLFREILIESTKNRYYSTKSFGESRGVGTCYICGERKEVYGFVLPAFGFKFATPDKPGFVGNFNQNEKWKEIPICEDCAITLEMGKRYLDQKLSFRFYGNKYYVIPSVVFNQDTELLGGFLEHVDDYPNEEYHSGLIEEEDYIPDMAIERGNVMRLIFVFYKLKSGGKSFDILKYVDDVLPSHLKKMQNSQSTVKNLKFYSEAFVKRLFGRNAEGNFAIFDLRKTKSKGGENNWYVVFLRRFLTDKEFLDIIGDILSNKPIDRRYLIHKFLETIKKEFRNKNNSVFKLRVVESLMLYDFLKEMNLLRGENMNKEKTKQKFSAEKLEEFFEEREGSFGSIEARAAFLVGALVNYVMYVQSTERGINFVEAPFRAKLYSLNLDERKVKKIFTAAVEKLSEYKRRTPLESIAADYLTRAGIGWSIGKDEISYYFAIGMVMGSALFLEEESKGGE